MLQVVYYLSENTEVMMLCTIDTSLKIHPMLIKVLNRNNTVFKAIISNMSKCKKESTLGFKKVNAPHNKGYKADSSTESKTNTCQYLGLTPEVKDMTFDMPQYGLQPGGHGCSMDIKVLGPISEGNKKELPISDPEIYDRYVIFNLSA